MKFGSTLFKLKIRKKYPVIVPSGEHPLDRRLIERGVIDILLRLKKNGYQAYLVGGCVRDILLGMTPKDFDIVTDAHPRQIKRLFARCFLIGKRFRLAHVYITADRFIEVATFRATAETQTVNGRPFQNNNVFGTIEEDALRRDFTVNALYYNSADSSIVDYTGGLEDIKKKTLRSIGDPALRFKEDPVRIIRAARFCARFGFRLSKSDYREALDNASLISGANANRMLEELYKILKCGASAGTFKNLSKFGVLKYWLPELDEHGINAVFTAHLSAIDNHRSRGEDIPVGVLIAMLFYDLFEQLSGETNSAVNLHEMFIKARDIFQPVAARLHLPRKESDRVCNIMSRRNYFINTNGTKRNSSFENRFIRNEHFGDSLLFYEILSETDNRFAEKTCLWRKLYSEYSEISNKKAHSGLPEQPDLNSRNRKKTVKAIDSPVEPNNIPSSDKSGRPERKRKNRNRTYKKKGQNSSENKKNNLD